MLLAFMTYPLKNVLIKQTLYIAYDAIFFLMISHKYMFLKY